MVVLLGAAIVLSPLHVALAISTESATDSSGDNAPIADPDDQLDEMANPDSGTEGSATIEMPPIDMPGDSGDYAPPSDSEDDPAMDAPAPADDSGDQPSN
ncbi:MAG TPA: hypothetical protein VGQ35_16350 [Dongiaceae bacterium]|nr:hypothetical protein [Dongiaceae bacterium]